MRWRFSDRLLAYREWESLQGRKAVSLEEYHLLAPLGLGSAFPSSLAVECGVSVARWLVLRSSGFSSSCLLAGVEGMAFDGPGASARGAVLEISVRMKERRGDELSCRAEVLAEGRRVAGGFLRLQAVPAASLEDPGLAATLWEELYGDS